jgi:hypothetical protein
MVKMFAMFSYWSSCLSVLVFMFALLTVPLTFA